MKRKKIMKKSVKVLDTETEKTVQVVENKNSINTLLILTAAAVLFGAAGMFLTMKTSVKSAGVQRTVKIEKNKVEKKGRAAKQERPQNNTVESVVSTETAEVVPQATQVPVTPYPRLFEAPALKENILNINLTEAKYLFDSGKGVFVDARSADDYTAGHISGAVSLPYNSISENFLKNRGFSVKKGSVIVVYCAGVGCHLSEQAAGKLYNLGYKNVVFFYSGFNEWVNSKFPVTTDLKG